MRSLIGLMLTLGVLAGLSQSCASTGVGEKLELMSAEDFASVQLRVELVTRVLAGRVVKDKPSSAERVLKVADAVDAVLADQALIVIGSGLISKRLIEQGWQQDEIMLGLLLVEDLIRNLGGIGEPGLPLGTHGRALLATISNALREAAVSPVSEDDLKAAEKVLENEGVRP